MNKDDLPLYLFEPRIRIWIIALNGGLSACFLWYVLVTSGSTCPTCWLNVGLGMYVASNVLVALHFAALRAWFLAAVGTLALMATAAITLQDVQDAGAIAMAIVAISFAPALHHFHALLATKSATID